MQKILQHRDKMGFSNTRLSVQTKLEEELNELLDEVRTPTSTNNMRKELGDVVIMIVAQCELLGYTLDDVVDYAIEVNEKR